MTYSNTAIFAFLVHCIVNHNALRNKHFRNDTPAGKTYRLLMLSVAVFYIFDAFWGVLYDAHMITAVFIDTMFYFIAMTATVFLWSRYVINYLQENNRLSRALKYVGWFFLVFIAVVLILNCFVPIMFWFDENGVYHAAYMRYVILALQIILFLFSACYVLFTAKGMDQSAKRRHRAIGAFGATMTIMVIMQVVYPLLPMYSVGCLLATCILHSFVLEDLKEIRHRELEEMARREEEHKEELGSAKQLAYIDPLTGVKNKAAYTEWEEKINDALKKDEQEPFAIAICDINDLKEVNDLHGHMEGDICIKNACARICDIFSHSPVFRVGGDEFIVFLSGDDYYRRNELMDRINTITKDPSKIRAG
ncbi:MAG: diguanylate cyclase [Clostridia bacterium]|nr:diguanylate cyclase [Clostridia bacterium]